MRTWMKWAVLAVLVGLPAIGYAVTKYQAAHACPITPDCPCEHE